MDSNAISTLQPNINIELGGRGKPTDITQKIAYRSTEVKIFHILFHGGFRQVQELILSEMLSKIAQHKCLKYVVSIFREVYYILT